MHVLNSQEEVLLKSERRLLNDLWIALLQFGTTDGDREARFIDRLSIDLRNAFPDMQGLSPRNLKYMRAFAAAWPDRSIVQEVLAQITRYHNLALIEKLEDTGSPLWYGFQGWGRTKQTI